MFYKTEQTSVEDDMPAMSLKCISLGEVEGITDVVLPQIMTQ